jgi:HEAT repeat protein
MRDQIRRWLCLCVALSVVNFVSSEPIGAAGTNDEAVAKIASMIEQIKAENSTTVRVNIAEQLSTLLQHEDRRFLDALDVKVIDDIAGLLSDRDDAVRSWAAAALGHIGTPANWAVPQLEKALKEIESAPGYRTGLSSASAIRGALQKITGKAPPYFAQ